MTTSKITVSVKENGWLIEYILGKVYGAQPIERVFVNKSELIAALEDLL